MRSCRQIKCYEGTRSQKLKEMINDKIIKEDKKFFKVAIKNKKLLQAQKQYQTSLKICEELKKKFDLIQGELGISWNSYNKKFDIDTYRCVVPKSVLKSLQNAQDLYSVGKVKEAREIWDSLINKFGIGD